MQKRKDLTLADKMRVLEALNQKKSQTSLAAEFGVSQSQISRIGKNRDLIMARYLQTDNSDRKRNRDGKNVDVDTALFRWYSQAQASKWPPMSGPILMEKASELAQKLDVKDFTPSAEWLDLWKEQHKIGLRRKSSLESSLDVNCVESWVNQVVPDILKRYHPDSIYCCKETALYYKTLPDSDNLECPKPRMTVLLCCNMSGKDRMVPYIIGARKEYEKNVMPPCIVNNDEALMTSQLFTKWLNELDRQLERENRNICMVLEKCVAHAIDFPLNNIQWYYTPVSSEFQLHPLSLGIVRNFKCHYRRELLTVFGLLQGNNNTTTENFYHNFNMTAAVGLIGDAWRKVTRSTVVTCFNMAMFTTSDDAEPPGVEYVTAPESMTEEQFSSFVDIDSHLPCYIEPDYADLFPILSWNEYDHDQMTANSVQASINENLPEYERATKSRKLDVDTKAALLQSSFYLSNGLDNGSDGNKREITPVSESVPSASQAVEACRILRQFLEHHGIEDFSPFYEIDLQVRSVMASAKRHKLKANNATIS